MIEEVVYIKFYMNDKHLRLIVVEICRFECLLLLSDKI